MTTITAVVGGHHSPPPPVRPVLPDASCHRRCHQPRSTVAAQGLRGVIVRVVEEEGVGTIVLIFRVLIHPGMDDGGKRSGVALVRLRGSHHQAKD